MRRGAWVRFVLAAGMVASAACGGRHETNGKPPTPVRLMAAEAAAIGSGVRYSANVAAKNEVALAFRQAGYVREIRQVRGVDGRARDLQEGDRVARGTVLARLRETEFEESVAQARSQVVEAEAVHRRSRQDFDRAEALYKAQSLTQPEYDQALTQLDVAQARVEGARAQLELARTAHEDCALKAPFDGVITSATLEVGQLASPQSPGFVLADLTAVRAEFGVSDVMLKDLKQGAALSIATQSIPGIEFEGRISRISPSADPKSRVFEVELTVPNPDGRLKPGMIAALQVGEAARSGAAADERPAVRLSAIVRPPGETEGYAVFVVEERDGAAVARVRRVELGDALGNSISVASGLRVGERVIVTGATLVHDGEIVRIVP